MNIKALLPWHTRIAAKLVLSRLPAGYAFWHRLGLFSHGAMDEPEYALGVFRSHFERSDFARKRQAFVAMELGPGGSAFSAVVGAAFGAGACHLVDSGRFAAADAAPYREMARHLQARDLPAPDLTAAADLEGVLRECRAHYWTQGLESLRRLPSASIDFVWSQAVLEHVRRGQFLATMKELRRLLRPDGICSHRIDLKDHLGGGLNNLRLPSSLWEKEWMASSGFYTNRLRMTEMMAMFAEAGFATELIGVGRWPRLPLTRRALAREFRGLADDELCVREFDVLLRAA